MKKIIVAFHEYGSLDYTQSRFYHHLQELYEIEIQEHALFHIYYNYPDFAPMHEDYRNTINIHVSEYDNTSVSSDINLIPPDMNMFDYAIGKADFTFEDRYYNDSTQNQSITSYIRHIFEANNPRRRSNAVIHLYYDTIDNLWENYRFLKKYRIKKNSFFYLLLHIFIRAYKTLYKFSHKNP